MIMIARTVCAAVAFGLFSTSLQAQGAGDDLPTIVAKTKELYDRTRTAKLTFVQDGTGGTTSGRLEYAAGNRFRLTLDDRIVVSDGSKTWSYLKDRNQVIITNAAADGQITPKDILQSFPGNYTTTLDGSGTVDGNPVWIVGCHSAGSTGLGDIGEATLYIDKRTFRFRKITVKSPTLGALTLSITEARYNLSLPSSRFSFEPPEGATIVDLSS